MKTSPLRQGPFLLQPAPLTLDGSEDGDATDILYLSFDHDDETDDDGETERLGVVLMVTQDGRVDVCLDVDKVEARWEIRQVSVRDPSLTNSDLISFAVPEHRTAHACSI
jgi:nucleoporin NUP82